MFDNVLPTKPEIWESLQYSGIFLISFLNVWKFLSYKYFSCLVELSQIFYIIWVHCERWCFPFTMWKVITFSLHITFVYRKVTVFLRVLFVLSYFPSGILRVTYVYYCIIFWLLPFQIMYPLISLSCHISLTKTSEHGQPCLAPYFSGNVLKFFPFKSMLSIVFL